MESNLAYYSTETKKMEEPTAEKIVFGREKAKILLPSGQK